MDFQIISGNTLSGFLAADESLLLDLRSRESYDKEHITGAVWMDWETAEETVPLLWAEYRESHGQEPQWIILYCDSGHISLITARDLAVRGYPVMSLNGGFRRWKGETTSSGTAPQKSA